VSDDWNGTELYVDDRVWLGRAARVIRKRRSISQEELGYRSGLHRNYVGAIERAEVNISFRTMLKLTGGMEVRLSELILLYEWLRDDEPPEGVSQPVPGPPAPPRDVGAAVDPSETEHSCRRDAALQLVGWSFDDGPNAPQQPHDRESPCPRR
jgi:transcriptional regulator with XRE-family HTH domain